MKNQFMVLEKKKKPGQEERHGEVCSRKGICMLVGVLMLKRERKGIKEKGWQRRN